MSDFASLTTREQMRRLRRVAQEALANWPLEVRRLWLINHDYNTTFGVQTEPGARYALRINVNSRRTPQELNAEAQWLLALARDTPITVPTPQLTRDGALRAEVYVEELGRELPVVLMSWLPGRELGFRASAARMREVGRLTAALHQHAATWELPPDAALPRFDDPLFNDPDRLTDHAEIDSWGPDARVVVTESLKLTKKVFAETRLADHLRPLHADLHGANLKWDDCQLAVFDFDDSGLGVPVLDLAISAYYLRPNPAREAGLLEGYADLAALPAYTSEQFEGLIASRNLLMMNDVIGSSTASTREMMPRYLRNSIRKLRHFLETGTYSHEVEGLEDRTP